MSDSDKFDKELEELWGDYLDYGDGKNLKAALDDLSIVEVPANLRSDLLNISGEKRAFPGFSATAALAAGCLIFIGLSIYLKIQSSPLNTYAILDSDAAIEATFFSEQEDEDIFDETLINIEELIWSV